MSYSIPGMFFARQTGDRVVLAACPAKCVTHSQAQFLYVEGFGDVVDCAQFEAGDTVIAFTFFGDKYNGQSAGAYICLQPLPYLESIYIRETHIEKYQVRWFFTALLQCFMPSDVSRSSSTIKRVCFITVPSKS